MTGVIASNLINLFYYFVFHRMNIEPFKTGGGHCF